MVVFLHHSRIALIVLVYVICFTLELNGGELCTYQVTRVRSETKAKSTPRKWPDCPGERVQCHITTYFTSYVEYNEDVDRCCDGWIQDGNNCSLPCTDNSFGQNCSETCNCTSVNSYCDPIGGCSCMAGWKEPNCSSPCDPGSHGYGCRKNCNCLNDASCDPTSGSCNCTPGWTGSYCNITCPAGRYGNDCLENCTCLEGAVCDPANGSCSCLPDRIGPNCTPIEESTTQQTKGMQESNHLGSDSNARLIGIVVLVVGGVSMIVAIVGGALWHVSKHYRGFVNVRASTTGLTYDQETNGRGATQTGLQTPESGALLVSTDSSQHPECPTSTVNADVQHMYETTITQSDDRTRNPLEKALSCVSNKDKGHSQVPTVTTNTSLAKIEGAYCDVGDEVNTPLQVRALHDTHCGEIEHTYFQQNTTLGCACFDLDPHRV